MELNPQKLAEERLKLADDYAKLGERKVELMYLWADYYRTNRPNNKSDAGTERGWDLTENGMELMVIKEKMRSKEHRISAIRTLIDVANNQARNQY